MGANNVQFSEEHKTGSKNLYGLCDTDLCKAGLFQGKCMKISKAEYYEK